MYSSAVCNNRLVQEQVRGIPIGLSSEACLPSKARLSDSTAITQFHVSSSANRFRQDAWKAEAKRGLMIPETVKRKLRFGARIVREGGVQKIFKSLFGVKEDERLLKVCQCYLSTTAGPIAGFLFVSTHKVAFCSEKSITVASPSKGFIRVHYKVLIPVEKIERVNESTDVKKRSRKYIQVVTVDGFDFWFMGFWSHKKAINCLQQAVFGVKHNVQ